MCDLQNLGLDNLLLWKDPRKTGVIFGSVLVMILATNYISCITVIANVGLALLTSTMSFRIYKFALMFVNANTNGFINPFQKYLNYNVEISYERMEAFVKFFVHKFNNLSRVTKEVFFWESPIKTIRFIILFYGLTYLGKLTTVTSLIMTCWICLFCLPRIYRDNQKNIDEALRPIFEKYQDITENVQKTVINKQS